MKNRLGKSEILGLILLAAIIVAVMGCAFLFNSYDQGIDPSLEPRITVIDTVAAPVTTKEVKKLKTEKKKRHKSKSKAKSKKEKIEKAPLKDPFTDTIIQYR